MLDEGGQVRTQQNGDPVTSQMSMKAEVPEFMSAEASTAILQQVASAYQDRLELLTAELAALGS